jgi:hypothetical protein
MIERTQPRSERIYYTDSTDSFLYRYYNSMPDLEDVEDRIYYIKRHFKPIGTKFKSATVELHRCDSKCDEEIERWGSTRCTPSGTWDLFIEVTDNPEDQPSGRGKYNA